MIAQWGFLGPPTVVNWSAPPDQLAYSLFNVYRNYNKDELVVIPKSTSHRRFQFLGIRILLTQNGDIGAATPAQAQVPAIPDGVSEALEEGIALSKIIRWWKRSSERLKNQRERLISGRFCWKAGREDTLRYWSVT